MRVMADLSSSSPAASGLHWVSMSFGPNFELVCLAVPSGFRVRG